MAYRQTQPGKLTNKKIITIFICVILFSMTSYMLYMYINGLYGTFNITIQYPQQDLVTHVLERHQNKDNFYVKILSRTYDSDLADLMNSLISRVLIHKVTDLKRKIRSSGRGKCRRKTNIAYIKTFKTGSSTFSNIFYR